MASKEVKGGRFGKKSVGLLVLALLGLSGVYIWSKSESQKHFKSLGVQSSSKVKPFEVNLATQAVPSQPTIDPADPYDPMPLRVGTVGATAFHHPFCPYAKQSLEIYGLEKRINYWTREQIAESAFQYAMDNRLEINLKKALLELGVFNDNRVN